MQSHVELGISNPQSLGMGCLRLGNFSQKTLMPSSLSSLRLSTRISGGWVLAFRPFSRRLTVSRQHFHRAQRFDPPRGTAWYSSATEPAGDQTCWGSQSLARSCKLIIGTQSHQHERQLLHAQPRLPCGTRTTRAKLFAMHTSFCSFVRTLSNPYFISCGPQRATAPSFQCPLICWLSTSWIHASNLHEVGCHSKTSPSWRQTRQQC